MEKCIVYYEAWQLQCCGDPFSVGERVKWTCNKPGWFKEAHGIALDYWEDHHGEDTHTIIGTITKIIAERSDVPYNDEPMNYDMVDVIREEIQHADGWESEWESDESLRRAFWGYIVELRDVTVGKTRNSWNKEYEGYKKRLPKRIFRRKS